MMANRAAAKETSVDVLAWRLFSTSHRLWVQLNTVEKQQEALCCSTGLTGSKKQNKQTNCD